MLPSGTTVAMTTMPACPFCVLAKEWLAARGISPEITIIEDPAERQAFYDSMGLSGPKRTMPQIFIVDAESGEKFPVGGYDALEKSGIG